MPVSPVPSRRTGWQALGFDNAWVVAEDASRRRLSLWIAVPLALAAVLGTVMVLERFLGGFIEVAPPPLDPAIARLLDSIGVRYRGLEPEVASYAVTYAVVFLPMMALGLLMPRLAGRPWPSGGVEPWKAALSTAVMAFLLLGFSIVLTLPLPGTRLVEQGALRPDDLALLAAAAGLTLFQTSSEEVLFRGWLQPMLVARGGPIVGVAATALLFAAVHGPATGYNPSMLANIALGGAFFGLLALRTGGLAAPVAAHFVWNFAYANVFGLSPNPGIDPFGSLVDIDTMGPVWLAGGASELINGLASTMALGLGCAVLLFWQPRRGDPAAGGARRQGRAAFFSSTTLVPRQSGPAPSGRPPARRP